MKKINFQSLITENYKDKINEFQQEIKFFLNQNPDISIGSPGKFIETWKSEFTNRIKREVNSRSVNFDLEKAINQSQNKRTILDEILITYLGYLKDNPIEENDYFKYADSYFKGKKLKLYYFFQDENQLTEIYKKIDKEKALAEAENREARNHYSRRKWETYVLYMMFKLTGVYISEFDKMFRVKKEDGREYNPLTEIPKTLRNSLPFEIKEYDIKQANPSFIFQELGQEPIDVYKRISKVDLNSLLNLHSGIKGVDYKDTLLKLAVIFGDSIKDIFTPERFDEKGAMFRYFAKTEENYIQKFVESNELYKYVRLHDSVVVLKEVDCHNLIFEKIEFREKPFIKSTDKDVPKTFYDKKQKTSVARYISFFKQEGFLRITEKENDELIITKNKNKIINRYNYKNDSASFLIEHINEFDSDNLVNQIAKDERDIIKAFRGLSPNLLDLQRDTKNYCFIPFKNGVVKISKDNIEILPYTSPKIKFFVEVPSLAHEFCLKKGEADKSVFKDFLVKGIVGDDVIFDNLSEEKKKNVLSFFSMIGYLISNYKDFSEVVTIVLTDDKVEEGIRKGGRGKGLIQNALTKVRYHLFKNGEDFRTSYNFKYNDLEREHDLYILDDVPANFDFDSFYSVITGGITAEKKGQKAIRISFEDTPKFIVSTNFAIRENDENESQRRRFAEYKLSPYWSFKNTPKSIYGHTFFMDWDEDEWNKFYAFLIECVQVFLKYGLLRIQYDKAYDNYYACFYSDAVEQEFIRILNVLIDNNQPFNVSDFLEEYKNGRFKHDKFFHQNKTRNIINAFLKYHQDRFKWNYKQSTKKWEVERINQDSQVESNEVNPVLPF